MKRLIVKKTSFSDEGVDDLDRHVSNPTERKWLLEYPTVYVVHDAVTPRNFRVYVGETTNIQSRTLHHLHQDPHKREDWKYFAESPSAEMYTIGHEHFNKSLTLDIENKLMLHLLGVDHVTELHNRRTNPQGKYYTSDELDSIFREIWRELHTLNDILFPSESIIRDSALFKASPFHKLTQEQLGAKIQIQKEIQAVLDNPERTDSGQLIMVKGAAGSGKTVLLSSLFYELFRGEADPDKPFASNKLDAYLVVNHDEQFIVYHEIARKLGLLEDDANRVSKPTRFINNHSSEEKVDIVLVDEAHLLWTQGKQSYRGVNQLQDLLERARVVVAVFDPMQTIATNQHWEPEVLSEVERGFHEVILREQMRVDSEPQTWQWIRNLVDDGIISDIPEDRKYSIKIFSDPAEMHDAIKQHARNQDEGLSRIIATYDWAYASHRSPGEGQLWTVDIGDFSIPWNLQLKPATGRTIGAHKNLSWAEREETINEAGSIFTIQGFDLNYAGVIIGPSVKYRDGRIIFDASASKNKNVTQRRTLQNKQKIDISSNLLKNELNVLMTRGIHGLYIYAVDEQLREALMAAQARRSMT